MPIVVVTKHSSVQQPDLWNVNIGPDKKLWMAFLNSLNYQALILDTGQARNAILQGTDISALFFELESDIFKTNRAVAENGLRCLENLGRDASKKGITVMVAADPYAVQQQSFKDSAQNSARYVLQMPYAVQELESAIRMGVELQVDQRARPYIRVSNLTNEFMIHARSEARAASGRSTLGLEKGRELKVNNYSICYDNYSLGLKMESEWIDFTPLSRNYLAGLSLMLHSWRALHDGVRRDGKRTVFELGVKK